MKTLSLYLLAVCWCCAWFCSCGGGGGSATVSVTQSQGEDQADFDPCVDCKGTLSAITSCLDRYGLTVETCGGEEEEEAEEE